MVLFVGIDRLFTVRSIVLFLLRLPLLFIVLFHLVRLWSMALSCLVACYPVTLISQGLISTDLFLDDVDLLVS